MLDIHSFYHIEYVNILSHIKEVDGTLYNFYQGSALFSEH